VFAKPALNYFNPLKATSNPVALPINTINVSKASNWSHAVSFNRPIGTSDEAEFLRVRQVVIDNIHE